MGSGAAGSKSIWVAAIDSNAAAGKDPSHPAFYLPGQELGSGNIRAFSVLAPCSGDGSNCEAGFDCCGGSCTAGKCGVPKGCSMETEACKTDSDCCSPTDVCTAGFCSPNAPR
jgi:hypothetical protein